MSDGRASRCSSSRAAPIVLMQACPRGSVLGRTVQPSAPGALSPVLGVMLASETARCSYIPLHWLILHARSATPDDDSRALPTSTSRSSPPAPISAANR